MRVIKKLNLKDTKIQKKITRIKIKKTLTYMN